MDNLFEKLNEMFSEVDTLETEIIENYAILGQKLHGQWQSGSADMAALKVYFGIVEAKQERIKAIKAEIEALAAPAKAEETEPAPTPAVEAVIEEIEPAAAPIEPVYTPVVAEVAPAVSEPTPISIPVAPVEPEIPAAPASVTCPKCGSVFASNAKFCRNCGTRLQ